MRASDYKSSLQYLFLSNKNIITTLPIATTYFHVVSQDYHKTTTLLLAYKIGGKRSNPKPKPTSKPPSDPGIAPPAQPKKEH